MSAYEIGVAAFCVTTLVLVALILTIKPRKSKRHGWIHGSQSD